MKKLIIGLFIALIFIPCQVYGDSATFTHGDSGDDGRGDDSTLPRWSDCATFTNSYYWNIFGDYRGAFLRYPNVTIPQGSYVTEAHLVIYAGSTYSGGASTIDVHDSDDSDAPTDCTTLDNIFDNLTGYPLEYATEAWSVALSPISSGSFHEAVNIVVNREGWESGNAITVFVHRPGGADRYSHSMDSPGTAIALYVEWTDEHPPPCTDCEGEYKGGVGGAGDSGYDTETTGVCSSVTTNMYGMVRSTNDTWQRFNNVTIPSGSTITSCHFDFVCASPAGATVNSFDFEDSDDTSVITDCTEFNAAKGNMTGNAVEWTTPAWTYGVAYESESCVTPLQAVIDRPGWASGNDMTAIFEYVSGTGQRIWDTDDYGAVYNEVIMHVEYTLPATGWGAGSLGGTDAAGIGSIGGTDIADIDTLGGT